MENFDFGIEKSECKMEQSEIDLEKSEIGLEKSEVTWEKVEISSENSETYPDSLNGLHRTDQTTNPMQHIKEVKIGKRSKHIVCKTKMPFGKE